MRLVEQAVTARRAAAPERGLRASSRRGAKALAQAILPASLVIWRGPEARQEPIAKPGRIALTFDDGPNLLTRDYLTVLERFGARATFFVVGEQCARYPELVAAIATHGHELAGHGYTHRRFPELSQSELSDELGRTQALLPRCTRSRALVRPPHGAVSLRSMLTCSRSGFTTALWSFDSGDCRNERPEDVESAFAERELGAGEIVLLHEGQPWTIDALPTILGTLGKAGHELVTVGELLG